MEIFFKFSSMTYDVKSSGSLTRWIKMLNGHGDVVLFFYSIRMYEYTRTFSFSLSANYELVKFIFNNFNGFFAHPTAICSVTDSGIKVSFILAHIHSIKYLIGTSNLS